MNKAGQINLLFVCSRNKWRSPTAEKIYADRAGIGVRSRGTSKNARQTVSEKDLQWATIIFVMETKHLKQLASCYQDLMRFKRVQVMGIPDIYQYMDPELISEITEVVDPILADMQDVD